MAKHILIIEDREGHLDAFDEAVNLAIEGGAIEKEDTIFLVGANQDAEKVYIEIFERPTYRPCGSFNELRQIIQGVKGDKLLLLDLALPGVHGTKGIDFFEDEEIREFYATLTNDESARSVILLYSSSLQLREKYERLKANGKEDRLHWLEKKPEDVDSAEEILYEGLNLFFNRPLNHIGIRLELNALHIDETEKDGFEAFFKKVNASRQFPKGALKWLTSDWVSKVHNRVC